MKAAFHPEKAATSVSPYTEKPYLPQAQAGDLLMSVTQALHNTLSFDYQITSGPGTLGTPMTAR